ncbi:hypothetical protein JRI60_22110 [Archangium violaceum]|uniref:hypothetical protein n=1 Tax=Archangium violaceum TaxID=83451 RepID=UPI00195009A0|nr:hypothetical protein [Archangium violaceum]QRO01519.1 hypothetical protein JRI60_22110 [Archangium violaceum]
MKKQGRRLGPFQLGRRCKHAAAELGHIHEARNVETGASSLVMMPGPRRVPRKNWQVRISFQTRPPFFALEMEQAPASGSLAELANLLTLLLAGLDAVRRNARTRAHLTREPTCPWLRRPQVKALAAAGLAVLALGGGFWLGTGAPSMDSPTPPPSTPGLGEWADAGFPPSFLIDGAERTPTGIAYPLPDKPFASQLRPPCRTKADHVAINGGCWVALERRPPCDEEQAEHQGKCYLPVMKAPRPPQSLSP